MCKWKLNRAKPVIGLAGGIGSGKSTVARMFAGLGCLVIDSDALAHEVLQSPAVKGELHAWLGDTVFNEDGSVNRKRVAKAIFEDAASAARLNGLIHPRVHELRDALMTGAMENAGVQAIVWDSPLLFETGLEGACDAVVWVEVPRKTRLARVKESRGWGEQDIDKREKLQFSLDKKAKLADYCIDNSGDEASTLRQVRQVLSQIFSR